MAASTSNHEFRTEIFCFRNSRNAWIKSDKLFHDGSSSERESFDVRGGALMRCWIRGSEAESWETGFLGSTREWSHHVTTAIPFEI